MAPLGPAPTAGSRRPSFRAAILLNTGPEVPNALGFEGTPWLRQERSGPAATNTSPKQEHVHLDFAPTVDEVFQGPRLFSSLKK